MSAKASGYAKELVVCPNGELISAREKLVLMVLADSHQVKAGRFTYPSVETIAADARCDRRSCQRYLDALERKGVIRRLRPANQGAGMMTFYFFPEIEAIPEGWQDAALFFGGRAGEGRQKGGRRAAETQLSLVERAQEREQEPEQKQKPPQPPARGAGGDEGRLTGILSTEPEGSGDIEIALRRVMDACGFTANRLRKKLRGVMQARMRNTGKGAEAAAEEMIDAWRRQSKQGLRLFKAYPSAEFFEGGYWMNSNTWNWDRNFIRDERRGAEARVGRN
jgi:Helix-turn-helix domain